MDRVLVVGAGVFGVTAACEAGRTDRRCGRRAHRSVAIEVRLEARPASIAMGGSDAVKVVTPVTKA
jgi:hypothetical protein